METFGMVVSIASGCMTLLGFIGFFVKYGNDKGTMVATLKSISEKLKSTSDSLEKIPTKTELDLILGELRKDIDTNAKDINEVGKRLNKLEIDNTKMITSMAENIGWIKSSVDDIKQRIDKKDKE